VSCLLPIHFKHSKVESAIISASVVVLTATASYVVVPSATASYVVVSAKIILNVLNDIVIVDDSDVIVLIEASSSSSSSPTSSISVAAVSRMTCDINALLYHIKMARRKKCQQSIDMRLKGFTGYVRHKIYAVSNKSDHSLTHLDYS